MFLFLPALVFSNDYTALGWLIIRLMNFQKIIKKIGKNIAYSYFSVSSTPLVHTTLLDSSTSDLMFKNNILILIKQWRKDFDRHGSIVIKKTSNNSMPLSRDDYILMRHWLVLRGRCSLRNQSNAGAEKHTNGEVRARERALTRRDDDDYNKTHE